jgi:DNA segregation ATPase FtsK/SpoIIIE, S-DNA-T family
MQLNFDDSLASEPAAPAAPPTVFEPATGNGLEAVAQRLLAHQATLAAIAQEHAQRTKAWHAERSRQQTAVQQELATLTAHAEEVIDTEADLAAGLADARREHEARIARLGEAVARSKQRIRERLEQKLTAYRAAEDGSQAEAIRRNLAAVTDCERRREIFRKTVTAQRARLAQADTALQAVARLARGQQAPPRVVAGEPRGDAEARLALLVQDLDGLTEQIAAAGRSAFANDSRVGGRLLNHGVLLVPHVAAAGLLPFLHLGHWLPWVAVSAVATQFLVPLFTGRRQRQLGLLIGPLRPALQGLSDSLTRIELAGRSELDPQGPLQQRLDRALALDAERTAGEAAARSAADRAGNALRMQEQRLRERLAKRLAGAEQRLRGTLAARAAAETAARRAAVVAAEARHAAATAAATAAWTSARIRLEEAWSTAWAALQDELTHTATALATAHPAWADAGWATWKPGLDFPSEIPLGTLERPAAELIAAVGAQALPTGDLATLQVPAALGFPAPASLLVRAGAEGRAVALRLLTQTVLRALTAFPPGRLRLTLVDPVGLGDGFAPFLAFGEHGEAILAGGVLNEAGAIEQGLGDLVAHLEVVIQKRLRGRYATIEEYNREAGEMQEALHYVVVADFPAAFSERALERLAVLARSGARCGVHLVIHHDDRKPLPAALDLAWFRRTGVVLREVGGRLVFDREGMADWRFVPEPAPTPAVMQRLVGIIGAAGENAQRVEVPFLAVAPATPAERWSRSSAKDLRIPLGKRGADRLQDLELGRGTAQHVLVGGRTGSGKSTLFHVLITSAALWYPPSELEYHLIDFKKGVEFKAYANLRLPHARVIAIESDREFGLSVLRQLDLELARRGDAFRKVGAHDLAAHRASGGEHLPRVLLLIDEFQEFFTEDDAIARDAALLLDRFVRQGRAFGLHVILGSQTLGGAYALAKSSLGQMGVRIALPCTETDAQLLLHEDNDGARLLTRPGDALYNDQAGMAAGNSPFQVCWLSATQEAELLAPLADAAVASGWKPTRPAVVFEGDAPSRLAEIGELTALLARPLVLADTGVRAWVGEASSLQGAAEVTLPAAAGGNLLLVGQNRSAAAATCGAMAVGLAARHAVGDLQLIALDGDDRDGPFATLAEQLAQHLPHGYPRPAPRDIGTQLAELVALIERRQSGADQVRSPVVLTVFGLQRLRQLRPDEDGGFGAERGSGPDPAESFGRILSDGPECGVHAIVWCDSLAAVQRNLGRRRLRDFEARILFQMSATDSTELIDDDGASRLGLHSALFANQGEGQRLKFRPCSLPGAEVVADLGAAIRVRIGA